MHDLAWKDTDALDDTCDIEQGKRPDHTTLTGVACMVVPPDKEDRDTAFQVLVNDTSGVIEVADRIIYDSRRWQIHAIQRDGHWAKLISLGTRDSGYY